jgi:hypothetical protein
MFEFALGMEVRFSKYSRTESSIANSNSNINTHSWQGLKKYQSGNTLMLLILINWIVFYQILTRKHQKRNLFFVFQVFLASSSSQWLYIRCPVIMGCRPVTSMMQARQRLPRRMPLRASTRRKMWKSEALLFWTSFPCFILNLNFDAKSREQEKASLNSMIKCSMTSLYFSYDSKRTLATTVYVSHYHYKHFRLNVFPMHWFTFHQVFELPFSLEAILTFIHPWFHNQSFASKFTWASVIIPTRRKQSARK